MQQQSHTAFYCSLGLHLAVLSLFIISFEHSSEMPVVENSDQNMKVISAVVMDLPPAPIPPPVAQHVEPKPVIAKPPQPVVKSDPQQTKIAIQKEQAIALNELHKKQLAAQKAIFEKQLLTDIKKQTHQNKKQQKALEQAMEKELQEQTAKALQKQLQEAQQHLASAKVQGIVNKYKALILQAISERWLIPPGTDKDLAAVLMIRLAPGGTVLDVQITKSSGIVALDRSARDAVFKASPLPVPEDDAAFNQFRQFVLKVKPITSEG